MSSSQSFSSSSPSSLPRFSVPRHLSNAEEYDDETQPRTCWSSDDTGRPHQTTEAAYAAAPSPPRLKLRRLCEDAEVTRTSANTSSLHHNVNVNPVAGKDKTTAPPPSSIAAASPHARSLLNERRYKAEVPVPKESPQLAAWQATEMESEMRILGSPSCSAIEASLLALSSHPSHEDAADTTAMRQAKKNLNNEECMANRNAISDQEHEDRPKLPLRTKNLWATSTLFGAAAASHARPAAADVLLHTMPNVEARLRLARIQASNRLSLISGRTPAAAMRSARASDHCNCNNNSIQTHHQDHDAHQGSADAVIWNSTSSAAAQTSIATTHAFNGSSYRTDEDSTDSSFLALRLAELNADASPLPLSELPLSSLPPFNLPTQPSSPRGALSHSLASPTPRRAPGQWAADTPPSNSSSPFSVTATPVPHPEASETVISFSSPAKTGLDACPRPTSPDVVGATTSEAASGFARAGMHSNYRGAAMVTPLPSTTLTFAALSSSSFPPSQLPLRPDVPPTPAPPPPPMTLLTYVEQMHSPAASAVSHSFICCLLFIAAGFCLVPLCCCLLLLGLHYWAVELQEKSYLEAEHRPHVGWMLTTNFTLMLGVLLCAVTMGLGGGLLVYALLYRQAVRYQHSAFALCARLSRAFASSKAEDSADGRYAQSASLRGRQSAAAMVLATADESDDTAAVLAAALSSKAVVTRWHHEVFSLLNAVAAPLDTSAGLMSFLGVTAPSHHPHHRYSPLRDQVDRPFFTATVPAAAASTNNDRGGSINSDQGGSGSRRDEEVLSRRPRHPTNESNLHDVVTVVVCRFLVPPQLFVGQRPISREHLQELESLSLEFHTRLRRAGACREAYMTECGVSELVFSLNTVLPVQSLVANAAAVAIALAAQQELTAWAPTCLGRRVRWGVAVHRFRALLRPARGCNGRLTLSFGSLEYDVARELAQLAALCGYGALCHADFYTDAMNEARGLPVDYVMDRMQRCFLVYQLHDEDVPERSKRSMADALGLMRGGCYTAAWHLLKNWNDGLGKGQSFPLAAQHLLRVVHFLTDALSHSERSRPHGTNDVSIAATVSPLAALIPGFPEWSSKRLVRAYCRPPPVWEEDSDPTATATAPHWNNLFFPTTAGAVQDESWREPLTPLQRQLSAVPSPTALPAHGTFLLSPGIANTKHGGCSRHVQRKNSSDSKGSRLRGHSRSFLFDDESGENEFASGAAAAAGVASQDFSCSLNRRAATENANRLTMSARSAPSLLLPDCAPHRIAPLSSKLPLFSERAVTPPCAEHVDSGDDDNKRCSSHHYHTNNSDTDSGYADMASFREVSRERSITSVMQRSRSTMPARAAATLAAVVCTRTRCISCDCANTTQVFQGFHPTGYLVAIKQVTKKAPKLVQLLRNEVHLLHRLSHPNILHFIADWEDEAALYMVMEYACDTLASVLKKFDRLLPGVVRHYVCGVLRALAYLHDCKSIVHRDVSPNNIIITNASDSSEAKLIDFGRSMRLPRSRSATLSPATTTTTLSARASSHGPSNGRSPRSPDSLATLQSTYAPVVGTPLFMSPQACQGLVHAANDVWSVGVITYLCLTGEYPYPSDAFVDPETFIANMGSGRVTPSLAALPETAANERDFIEQCLQADYTARPSAAALLNHPFFIIV